MINILRYPISFYFYTSDKFQKQTFYGISDTIFFKNFHCDWHFKKSVSSFRFYISIRQYFAFSEVKIFYSHKLSGNSNNMWNDLNINIHSRCCGSYRPLWRKPTALFTLTVFFPLRKLFSKLTCHISIENIWEKSVCLKSWSNVYLLIIPA